METCFHFGYFKLIQCGLTFRIRQRSWTTYQLTPLGEKALNNMSVSIVLPVTPTIREMECKEEEKQQHTLQQLDRASIKTDQLPKEEVESGDGEVIRAFSKWYGYLETL